MNINILTHGKKMKVVVDKNYHRKLIGEPKDMRCHICRTMLELPVLFCAERNKAYHRDCFAKFEPVSHSMEVFRTRYHLELSIDELGVNDHEKGDEHNINE